MSSYYFMFHSDPHTLVELMNFSALGKMQPFSVDISTNCLLLMVSVSTLSRLPIKIGILSLCNEHLNNHAYLYDLCNCLKMY